MMEHPLASVTFITRIIQRCGGPPTVYIVIVTFISQTNVFQTSVGVITNYPEDSYMILIYVYMYIVVKRVCEIEK